MASAAPIDAVSSICPPKHHWRIKVRVVHKWIADSFGGESKPATLELILMDQYGGKIQATVRKIMFRKWAELFVEGNVYVISFFHLIGNIGSYRPTQHPFRILFNTKTNVHPAESSLIPRWGFSLKNAEELNDDGAQSEFLVDMLGILTATSKERTYVKDGIVTKLMLLEISDEKGTVECALFGDYVQIVSDFLAGNTNGKPIVVFQLAKLKTFRGKNVLQNVMKASRILFNHEIAEAVSLMERISLVDLQVNLPIGRMITSNPAGPLFEDFISNHPRKLIKELNETTEEGFFIVLARVVGLLQDDQWWYFACKCHKAVTFDDGLYYCAGCFRHVMDVTPRYRIKVEVEDSSDSANFLMFDSDANYLINKTCKEMLAEAKDPKSGECSPLMEQMLVGRELLFKVEKKSNTVFQFDDSYRIKRICDEPSIIEAFKAGGADHTPELATFAAPFTSVKLAEDGDGSQGVSEASEISSPEVLTPSLSAGPSYVGCSGNIFKRKVDDDLKKVSAMPKLKLKQVKVEKK